MHLDLHLALCVMRHLQHSAYERVEGKREIRLCFSHSLDTHPIGCKHLLWSMCMLGVQGLPRQL